MLPSVVCVSTEDSVRSRMSFRSKRELLAQVAPRYHLASHDQKSVILDEFVAATSYARKYAIRLLTRSPVPAPSCIGQFGSTSTSSSPHSNSKRSGWRAQPPAGAISQPKRHLHGSAPPTCSAEKHRRVWRRSLQRS